MGRIAKNDGKGDLVVVRSVAASTFLGLPEDEQEELRCLAMPIFTLIEKADYKGANEYMDSLKMDDTYQLAMWALFGSAERSAMKKASK